MKNTLTQISPTGLDDLAVANALFRPGSMKFIPNYIKRKHGKEEYSYLHEDLEGILNTTYGIIVFQEQLIEIGRLAGMRNPDEIRKATAKKKIKLMNKVEPELKEGLKNRGWSQDQVDEMWSIILDFAKYSFNKSHSYAYAMIAYICAFLKAYHPAEFNCAAFNSHKNANQDKWQKIGLTYQEAIRTGIEVTGFDYRLAEPICKVVDGKIMYGTHLIKGCNEQVAIELKNVSGNKHDTFIDMLVDIEENCTINKTQLTGLIELGYFSVFGSNKALMSIYDSFQNGKGIKYEAKQADKTKQKRYPLLLEKESEIREEKLEDVITDKIRIEEELLGFVKTDTTKFSKKAAIIESIMDKYKNPVVTLKQLATDKTKVVKVKAADFYKQDGSPRLYEGDMIEVVKINMEKKWKQIDGKWTEIDETEPVLRQLVILDSIKDK